MTKNKEETEPALLTETKDQVTFVVLKEKDDNGKQRVIYASSVEETKYFIVVKHTKKDGTPCTSKLNPEEISKIYSEDK